MSPPKALLIGFTEQLTAELTALLTEAEFEAIAANRSDITYGFLSESLYHSVLVYLPTDTQGAFEILANLRNHADIPVIAINEAGGSANRIRALEAGANDVLSLPLDQAELLARLHSLLRRCYSCTKIGRLCYGDIIIDQVEQSFRHRTRNVPLSRMEMRLLRRLAQADQNTVSTETLLKDLWGMDSDSRRQSLRVLIRQLRNKIETDPQNPSFLLNDHGVGYRLRRL
ncbi:response regulator transcription factor [Ferrovibrio sp.]|uniref:response regulator transcription factor n=1 Tax=Ferrovibrio sp. TaxID=1917215 RepID=UPI001B658D4C|nr:response regulator transcription factor [Ferrovibrio sp.]MBP7063986.1 response regulator transcription factor [Ferrovibrio sp.]